MKRPAILTQPLSVLVVDGYPDTAASLALVLNFEGFAARAALSGEEALASAAAEPPEVVVIEPRTPGGGWDLARRLTEPVAGKRPLLVVFTTDTTAAGRHSADAAGVGVSMYLVKPENPAVLIQALRQFAPPAGGGMPVATGTIGSPDGRLERILA
jgi:CheY-like chemotaxis protein